MQTQIDFQVGVSTAYSEKEIIDMLKARGIRKHSRNWRDYELGKAIINGLESGDTNQSQYYDLYLCYVTNWVGV